MAKPHIAFTIGTFDGVSKKEATLFEEMQRRSKNTPIIFVSSDERAFARTGEIPIASVERRLEMCGIFGNALPQVKLPETLQRILDEGKKLVFYGIKDDAEYTIIVDSIAPILKKLHLPRKMLKIMV